MKEHPINSTKIWMIYRGTPMTQETSISSNIIILCFVLYRKHLVLAFNVPSGTGRPAAFVVSALGPLALQRWHGAQLGTWTDTPSHSWMVLVNGILSQKEWMVTGGSPMT